MQSALVIRAQLAQETIDEFRNKDFEWGRYDCAHMVADCVRRFGHPDPIADLRRYSTRLGAVRAMKRAGIESFEARLSTLFPEIAPAASIVGDIVTIASDDPAMPALGLRLTGDLICAYVGYEDGVPRCAVGPFTVADRAWRVF